MLSCSAPVSLGANSLPVRHTFFAPYRVANGELVAIPNPIASVKFFTNSKLPVNENEMFYIKYKDRLYKKVALTDYGKCALIIGERIGNKC